MAPYTELDNELRADATWQSVLGEAVANRQLPQSYFDHEAVRATPAGDPPCMPIGMFVDGVPFQKKDGVIGFWIYTLITGVRHLAIVVRKSELCRCGCKGWCTMWIILDWLRFVLVHLVRGMNPAAPYANEAPWMEGLPAAASAGNSCSSISPPATNERRCSAFARQTAAVFSAAWHICSAQYCTRTARHGTCEK